MIKSRFRADIFKSLLLKDTFRKVKKVELLLFSHDVNRSNIIHGKNFDRFLDPIAEHCQTLGLNSTHVSLPFSRLASTALLEPSIFINRAALIQALIKRVFGKKISIIYMQRIYNILIERSGCKIIFVIGASDALCKAAKNRKVKIVEVLHGKGYADIPWKWDLRDHLELPDYAVSFDKTSSLTFKNLENKGLKTYLVEDYWIKKFYNMRNQELLNKSAGWPTRVLFSLTWGFNRDHHGAYPEFDGVLINGFIPEAVLDAIRLSHSDVLWLMRIHPVQMQSFRKHELVKFLTQLMTKNPNIEWELASHLPLPVVLNSVTKHVTMHSGTSIDAAQVGVPTALLCPTLGPGGKNQTMFKDYRDSGQMKHFKINDHINLLKWALEPINATRETNIDESVTLDYFLTQILNLANLS